MIAVASVLVLAPSMRGDVHVQSTAELRTALRDAKPGTRVLLAAGNYEGFSAAGVSGEAERPIVVASADPRAPAVFTGAVQLLDVAFLELAGFVIERASGNGLNIDDGGTFESPSHHVVLRELAVRDCGGRGNEDGIKLSGVADFRVERCTVERWGRGGSAIDMVGCRNGVVGECTLRDRDQDAASSGVQIKGGSRDIAVRACRFEHAGQRAVNIGGSTGLAYFRPAPAGFEARDVIVEGCTFIGSTSPIAFVGCDGANVRFNTFYRPRKWLVRILQETLELGFVPCRAGKLTDNLVVYRASDMRTAVNVGDATAPETFEFARNYWHCEDEPQRARPGLPVEESHGVAGADPLFLDASKFDLRLAPNSPAGSYGAQAWPQRAK
jgi:hypothetical protein